MLKKLKLLKKHLSQKRRWSCDFLPRKTLVAQKHRAISRQEKDGILYPCKMATGIPAGSRQESRFLPGSCREMKNLAGKRNFPAGILTGSWQEKILAGILARIPARVSVPGVILPRHR